MTEEPGPGIELERIVRPSEHAVQMFFASPWLRYVCGSKEIARHPRARLLAAAAATGQLVALCSQVDIEPGTTTALAVIATRGCSHEDLELLLRAATHEASPPGHLVTCFAWGDEPDHDILAHAGLSVVACASCDGISDVILAVTPDSATPRDIQAVL